MSTSDPILTAAVKLQGDLALASADADALVALATPVPAPVPVPTPTPSAVSPVRYVDVSYAQKISMEAFEEAHVDMMVLGAPAASGGPQGVNDLADIDCYVYVALAESGPGNIQTAVPFATADLNESWFCHDATGARITKGGGVYVLNIGVPAVQQAALASVLTTLCTAKWRGVFFDIVDTTLAYMLPAGVKCVELPNNAAWQAAMFSMLSVVCPAVRAAGFQVIANLDVLYNYPGLQAQWLSICDGMMIESWMNAGQGEVQQTPYFLGSMNLLAWCQANGKICLCRDDDATQAGLTYGLAAMLLAAQPGLAFFAVSTTNYITSQMWLPVMADAMLLGAPVGPMVVSGANYSRQFQNGTVTLSSATRAAAITLSA